MAPVVIGQPGKGSTELWSDAAPPTPWVFLTALVDVVPAGAFCGSECSDGSSHLA